MSAIAKASPGLATSAVKVDPLLSTPEAVKAQGILDEVSSTIQTSEKIIPARLLPTCFPAEFPTYFKQFGAKFLQFLKHNEYYMRVRTAVERIALVSGVKSYDVQNLAITRFNVAVCSDLSTLIRLKAKLAGIKNLWLVDARNAENAEINHAFLLIGKKVNSEMNKNEKAIKRKENVIDIVKTVKSGIIVDGFLLSKVFAAKDVMRCDDFVNFLNARKIVKINSAYQQDDITKEEIEKAFAEADRLYSIAKKLLPDIPSHNALIREAIQENEPHYCAELLGDKIPNTKWSKNATKQKVWFEGTEDKAKEIAEYLNAHGIQATVGATAKSTHLAMIDNPDYNLIEKLPPFEQWLKEKTSKDKEATKAAPKESKQEGVVASASKKKKKKKGKS
jgi:hypothetical protein